MQFLFQFFATIATFLQNFFLSVGNALSMVFGSLVFLRSYSAILPPLIGGAVMVFVAVYVVRFILLK